ncbi:PatA/PatG family cyanobactin maturation protease [Moorena producens JHB]|uniref:PatA/PatG family cyanobactin maturation protease n=1 Tax=Moorena producens (strain JHB) TaxID=1454205 RepID=A0A1D9G449_MOOP1|nr:PatA/PatG family cyanobactin maturation protease [Moorena producens]AOY82363.1 PatA/PatG family cyanobactin maturation protease [Moorena producens JHB]
MPDLSTIPGFTALQSHTTGDSRLLIAVLDGSADLDRACFQGAKLSRITPFWSEELVIDPDLIKVFRDIDQLDDLDDDTKKEKLEAAIPDDRIRHRIFCDFHATHIASTIFGQPGSPVEGIAPGCRGINIPIDRDGENFINPLNLVHAFNQALELGANIIHCAACHPTQSGVAHELLEKAVRQAQENNVLVVAPGGNDKGECWCIPAVLPGVLTVGAYKDNDQPAKFSNFGGQYNQQGVLAPGENILGAQPGTDEAVRKKGTSCAAPVITGISALLMSLQLQQGAAPDAEAIRAAITNSAIPCDPEEVEEPERCLLGKVNIAGAFELITGQELAAKGEESEITSQGSEDKSTIVFISSKEGNREQGTGNSAEEVTITVSESEGNREQGIGNSAEEVTITVSENQLTLSSDGVSDNNITANNLTADNITANTTAANNIVPSAGSNLVYVMGTVGYDFGTEARRDSFKQLMPPVEVNGVMVPPNPYDARQMGDYLGQNLYEAKSLIWTLNLELTPIYALEPVGAFADDTYGTLQDMLASEALPENDEEYIERVSMAGRLSQKTVKLFSGQELPVLKLYSPRGMYGWTINTLVDNAIEAVRQEQQNADEAAIRKSLTAFLHRVYYDLRNLGQADRDRAINYAAINAFQAAESISEAVAIGMELHSIEVEKSPFCRYDSNCWDVKLKFFDPDHGRRAKKVYRFTIDVIDLVPVTLGHVRSWSVPK